MHNWTSNQESDMNRNLFLGTTLERLPRKLYNMNLNYLVWLSNYTEIFNRSTFYGENIWFLTLSRPSGTLVPDRL